MDRRLIVMRHAKSSWETDASDHDRPLNDRGRSEAPRVARHLTAIGWQPGFVLSSDAVRTRETFALMSPEWNNEVPVEFFGSLYLAGYRDLLQVVSVVPDAVSTLMVLGHNPGWEDVVQALSGEDIVLKTASAALLTGQGETWLDATHATSQWTIERSIRGREC